MIRLTYCLHRLPHLSRAEFLHYWLTEHASKVREVRHILRMRKYVQLHALDHELNQRMADLRQSPVMFDGVAQIWWDSFEDLGATATEPEARKAREILIEDEKKFIDHTRSPLWYGKEEAIF